MDIYARGSRFLRPTIGQQGRSYHIRNPRPLSQKERRFFTVLEDMTEPEYTMMAEAIREAAFPFMPKTGVHNYRDPDKDSFFLPAPDETEAPSENPELEPLQILTYDLPF